MSFRFHSPVSIGHPDKFGELEFNPLQMTTLVSFLTPGSKKSQDEGESTGFAGDGIGSTQSHPAGYSGPCQTILPDPKAPIATLSSSSADAVCAKPTSASSTSGEKFHHLSLPVSSRDVAIAKVYQCTKRNCHKIFPRKYELDVHMRRHTGETAYTCCVPGCGKKFKWRSSMANHNRSHMRRGQIQAGLPIFQDKNVVVSSVQKSATTAHDFSREFEEAQIVSNFAQTHEASSAADFSSLCVNANPRTKRKVTGNTVEREGALIEAFLAADVENFNVKSSSREHLQAPALLESTGSELVNNRIATPGDSNVDASVSFTVAEQLMWPYELQLQEFLGSEN